VMISQMTARMRTLIEEMGTGTPSVCFIGLGDITPDAQGLKRNNSFTGSAGRGTVSGKATKGYKINRPTRTWTAGALGWKGARYQANGSIYIPMDYVPFSTLKRSAKYNHILNQIGMEWLGSLPAVGVDWDQYPFSTNDSLSGKSHKEELAMLNLVMSQFPAFGHTDSPAPADSMLDHNTIAGTMKGYLTAPFTSAFVSTDVGILGSVAQYTDAGGFLTDDPQFQISIRLDDQVQYVTPLEAMRNFIKHQITFAFTLACLEGKWKLSTYPAVFMYEGGPKPEHVMQRLMMNFRPDRDYGGGSSLPYTLVPRTLNPGQTAARVPTLFELASEAGRGGAINAYYGPRDPVVISDVKTSTFYGDRPETIIEEEFYYTSPVINREGSSSSTYRNYRTVNIAELPRPNHYMPGLTPLGFLLQMTAHHTPLSGPVYEQPMLEPWYRPGADKTLVTNHVYDRTTTLRIRTPEDRNRRLSTAEQRFQDMLAGQTADNAALQNRDGLDKRDNPQVAKSTAIPEAEAEDAYIVRF